MFDEVPAITVKADSAEKNPRLIELQFYNCALILSRMSQLKPNVNSLSKEAEAAWVKGIIGLVKGKLALLSVCTFSASGVVMVIAFGDLLIQFYFVRMETRSYMFSTAKKRSTLLENKGIEFARDDKAAPRMLIMKKECPSEYQTFMDCLEKNPGKPENCLNLRQELFECGKPGIKKANSDPTYTY